MNKRRLIAIAKWLEAGAKPRDGIAGFSMAEYFAENECGTTCCIAGAALAFFGDSCQPGMRSYRAAVLLGLDIHQADDLFFAAHAKVGLYAIDAPWAARCIRKLIETGKVDWRGTRRAS